MSGNLRIGLVIGSGAVKCAASIGLLRVLQRENIDIDLIVGCSGGAFYASSLALGYSIEKQVALTNALWTPDLLKGYASNLSAVRSGDIRFTERSGLVDDTVLMNVLETLYDTKTFADIHIPLFLIATDFMTGEQVLLTKGAILDAVRASIAIPTVFPPWELDGRLLVDGAASDPLPIDVAIKQGADIIIAMGFELDYRSRMRSMTAVNSHLNSIYINNLFRTSLSFHTLTHHHEIILIVPQFDRPISAFDTQHIPYIIEEGERAAEHEVAYLKKLLDSQ